VFRKGIRRLSTTEADAAAGNLAERKRELDAREADLNRREAAVRRAEELREDDEVRISLLERREREVEQMREALEAQRARLDDVRAEYEARRETLRRRTVELEAERDKLRGQNARAVAADLETEVTEDMRPPEPPAQPAVEVGPDWWSKQLGSPLEAA
jgi:chromosome segregation ATPase